MSRSNRQRETEVFSRLRPQYTPYLRVERRDVTPFLTWSVAALEYLPLPIDAKIVLDKLIQGQSLPNMYIDVPLPALISFIGWAELAQECCAATDEQQALVAVCKEYRDVVEQQERRVRDALRDYWKS